MGFNVVTEKSVLARSMVLKGHIGEKTATCSELETIGGECRINKLRTSASYFNDNGKSRFAGGGGICSVPVRLSMY
jgi:hypothetical protein